MAALSAACLGCVKDPGYACTSNDQCGALGTCESTGSCSLPDPACRQNGRRYQKDARGGLAGQCVTAEPDAAMVDAAVDSAVVDGQVADAAPYRPVTNGQSADLVLGQTDFMMNQVNQGLGVAGATAATLASPYGVASDGTHLWVFDGNNHRVLQWDSLPGTIDGPAAHVLGQPNMNSRATGLTRTGLSGRGYISSDGTHVCVSDTSANRVLIWNTIPTSDGRPADVVLGQADFTSNGMGNGSGQLNAPVGLYCDGSRLLVADQVNNRIMVWTHLPTATVPADLVLGWPNFGMGNAVVQPPTASSLAGPADVTFTGGRVLVVDGGNNRVLIWNAMPASSGVSADIVVGATGFTTFATNAGAATPSPKGFSTPNSLAAFARALLVSDEVNSRVVAFVPPPTTSGESAVSVVGQPDFSSSVDPMTAGTKATTFAAASIALAGNRLFVTDTLANRVLRFTLAP